MILDNTVKYNGVYCIGKVNNSVTEDYLKVRDKEHRILSDKDVLHLPIYNGKKTLEKEWKLRTKSMIRFHKYMLKQYQQADVLDLGCGNGWFTNSIASLKSTYQVYGIDVNTQELEQASRVFTNNNVKFIKGDIYKTSQFKEAFNIIVINAAIQYFFNIEKLFEVLKSYLKKGGELHIIDSPFYKTINEVNLAKERTKLYYNQLDVPNMVNSYFHHNESSIKNFDVLYEPKSRFYQLIFGLDSPFKWVRLRHI